MGCVVDVSGLWRDL